MILMAKVPSNGTGSGGKRIKTVKWGKSLARLADWSKNNPMVHWRHHIEGAIGKELDMLARWAMAHPEKINLIVKQLGIVCESKDFNDRPFEVQELFVEKLGEHDKSKPKIDMRIIPESLFPIDQITKVLAEQGRSVDLKTASQVRQGRLTVWEGRYKFAITADEAPLATIEISPTNVLETDQTPGPLHPGIAEFIINENSRSFEREAAPDGYPIIRRRYYGLNWWAGIKRFWLDDTLREKGVGETWWQQHIKPFLKSSGFDLAAVHGTCMSKPAVAAFWSEQGFKAGMALNIANAADDIVFYISFRKI